MDSMLQFPSVKSTTLKRLLKEAREIAERFADLHILLFNTSLHKQVLELKAEVAGWKYQLLTQEELAEEAKPVEEARNVNKGKDLTVVVEVLRSSFMTLLELRTSWRNLVLFFAELQIILEITLSSSVNKYVTNASRAKKKLTNKMRDVLLTEAMEVCRAAFTAGLASTSYDKIHEKYFGPNLAKVTQLLSFTNPDDVEVLRKEINDSCNDALAGIQALTNEVSQTTRIEYVNTVYEICGA